MDGDIRLFRTKAAVRFGNDTMTDGAIFQATQTDYMEALLDNNLIEALVPVSGEPGKYQVDEHVSVGGFVQFGVWSVSC